MRARNAGPRAIALLLATLAWVGLVSGCGREEPARQEARTAKGFPLEVQHQFGTTIIPEPPSRVVNLVDDEFVVALGVVPVAIPRNPNTDSGVTPWLEEELGSSRPELLDVSSGYPFEQIAALEPDLIVGAVTDSNYATLSEIAPTIEYVKGPNIDTWQERTLLFGRVFAREERAEQLVADVEARISEARALYPEIEGRTFSLSLNYAPGTVSTIRQREASVRVLEDLGMELSEAVQQLSADYDDGRSDVSLERLDVLDADIVILSHTTPELQAELEENALFRSLEAVSRGSYVDMDLSLLIALSRPSPLNIPAFLEDGLPHIAEATRRA